MKHARRQNGISDPCLRAVIIFYQFSLLHFQLIFFFSIKYQLEDLIRVTDAGSDWQVDSLLKTSCSSVVETACKNPVDSQPASVISCLMDKWVIFLLFVSIEQVSPLTFMFRAITECFRKL